MRDTPTAGFIDDQPTTLNGPFAVTDSQTYDTLIGQRTVPVLVPMKLTAHVDKFTRKDEARNWTAVADGRDATAIYCGLDRGAVKLAALDGTVLRVPASKLVEADRQFVLITQRLQKNPRADRPPR